MRHPLSFPPPAVRACRLLALLAAIGGLSLEGRCLADETRRVEVLLADGRTFSGQLDPQTGDRALWLRSAYGRALVRRPVAWDRIAGVTVDGRRWTAADFRPVALNFVASASAPPPQPGRPYDSRPIAEPLPAPQPAAAPRIVAITVDAWIANWDADVEADGLVLAVTALDHHGRPVDIAGTLAVELIGARGGAYRRGDSFPTLGRWTIAVGPQPGGAAVHRLPFQAVHPDFDLDILPHGLVHSRLTVPGHGVFEATTSPVRLRAFNPIRDRLQQTSSARFFPQERTSVGRHWAPQNRP